MRQQKAIVAASGPRTPINGRVSSRIGVPRNGGDSGIFTAADRLCAVCCFECNAAEAAQNQKNSSRPSGRGPRQARRQRLRHAFFPPTAAPGPLDHLHNTRSPGGHRRLPLACGEVTPFGAPTLSPHAITTGRPDERTSPPRPAPNRTLPVEPFCIPGQEARLWPATRRRTGVAAAEARLAPERAQRATGVLPRGRRPDLGPGRIRFDEARAAGVPIRGRSSLHSAVTDLAAYWFTIGVLPDRPGAIATSPDVWDCRPNHRDAVISNFFAFMVNC
jgi:hypothetical protein